MRNKLVPQIERHKKIRTCDQELKQYIAFVAGKKKQNFYQRITTPEGGV